MHQAEIINAKFKHPGRSSKKVHCVMEMCLAITFLILYAHSSLHLISSVSFTLSRSFFVLHLLIYKLKATLLKRSSQTRPRTMRYPIKLASKLLLLSAITTTQGFMITFYSNSGCRYASTTQTQRPEQGCQTYRAGESMSQIINGDKSDKSFYLVYFSDKECNPDKIIKKEELGPGYTSKCSDTSGKYGSFEVWDVCEKAGCLD